MRRAAYLLALAFAFQLLSIAVPAARAQGAGTDGSIVGVVADPSGAVIPGATVKVLNPVTGFQRTTTTDAAGHFEFSNVPLNNYHLAVTAAGFGPIAHDVDLVGSVPVSVDLTMKVLTQSTTVTVTTDSGDLVNASPSTHTDVNMSLLPTLPTDDVTNGLSSAVTLATPGIAADSNGMFHPLGEHSDTTFTIDGQPISDQQSRNFSNQLTANAVQSIKVINGMIPPEYGDKASIVVQTTTKSGLGDKHPTGDISASYGSFGTALADANLGIGTQAWGNFVDVNGVNGGRFLDTPEFTVMHAYGNNENFFDRIDYNPTPKDTLHLDLTAARSWFQNPNQFDQQFPTPNPYNPQGLSQDQRQENLTYNIGTFWTHLMGTNSLLSVAPFLRQDNIHYYPSADVFADTPATLEQSRRLQNAGITADYSYVKGIHNLKVGAVFQHTFLDEGFGFGITSPTYNAVCQQADGTPVVAPGITNPDDCVTEGYQPNPGFLPGELQYDLTRGGKQFAFKGHTDIKEETLYAQDTVLWKNWQFLVGARGDNYNGLSSKYMLEPRAGATYQIHKTGTVINAGYSRLMPTPYNENLILSSSVGSGGLANNLGGNGDHPLTPASRNQYDVGFQQAFGKYVVVSGSYFWKYTKGDYDFDVILNTPLTFPIQWKKSDISGGGLRVALTPIHGVSAFSVMGHSHSLFYPPEVGGLIFNDNSSATGLEPFLIDHDQAFEQNTHLQYQPKPTGPWYGLTWRYDSGLVAGNVPFGTAPGVPVSLTYLTADQQQQIRLSCNGVLAALSAPLVSCLPEQLKSPLVTIPQAGTETPYGNPPRIAPRNLFDMDAGWDNVLHRKRYQTNLSLTVTNVTNKVALYNFLSTFSGTHFVPPRMITAQAVFNF
ncbi:MAG: carboxypeptidase regulatory-like domain-containing protein [Acidobacteriaceae bacterium]